jgi:hypothetical protein
MSFGTAESHFQAAMAHSKDPAITELARGLTELTRSLKRELQSISHDSSAAKQAAERAAR